MCLFFLGVPLSDGVSCCNIMESTRNAYFRPKNGFKLNLENSWQGAVGVGKRRRVKSMSASCQSFDSRFLFFLNFILTFQFYFAVSWTHCLKCKQHKSACKLITNFALGAAIFPLKPHRVLAPLLTAPLILVRSHYLANAFAIENN